MTRPIKQRALDAALAIGVWLGGFVLLRRFGTFVPLTVGAVSLAAAFLARDPALRAGLVPRPRSFLFGVLAAAAMIAMTYAGYPFATRTWPGLGGGTAALYSLLGAGQYGVPLAALLLSATAAAEEVIFRGALLPANGPAWSRCLIASGIYAIAHLTSGSWLLVALAFVCGLFWAGVRLASGSLLAPIVVHVAWDLAILVVHPLAGTS